MASKIQKISANKTVLIINYHINFLILTIFNKLRKNQNSNKSINNPCINKLINLLILMHSLNNKTNIKINFNNYNKSIFKPLSSKVIKDYNINKIKNLVRSIISNLNKLS